MVCRSEVPAPVRRAARRVDAVDAARAIDGF